MRVFLFKLLFHLTWWVAPDTPRVNRVFDLYLDEHLTCERQREVFSKFMPPRISDKDQPRSHYSDYEEAKEYHESS